MNRRSPYDWRERALNAVLLAYALTPLALLAVSAAAPLYERPVAPLYERPVAPLYERPVAPLYERPTGIARLQPGSPAHPEHTWSAEVCELCGRVGAELAAPCPGVETDAPRTAGFKSAPRVRF